MFEKNRRKSLTPVEMWKVMGARPTSRLVAQGFDHLGIKGVIHCAGHKSTEVKWIP